MRTIRVLIAASCLAATVFAVQFSSAAEKPDKAEPVKAEAEKPAAKPKIQMAILLDTSNSMDGLINQTRAQLWKIVNEFATAKRNGQRPDLQVALFEYGNNSIDASAGYVRMVVPLSDDLDKVSEELFGLKTNGGNEYCGQVISEAIKRLKWDKADTVMKTIFIAGNEPFTQGKIDPYKAVQTAIEKGVTVSTIYCGPESTGVNTGWQKGAQLADGSFISINQDRKAVAVATPFDKELVKLSGKLNSTYVFYGAEKSRRDRAELQKRQDVNAAKAPGAAVTRAVTKGGALYQNAQVDLVDGLKNKAVKLEALKDDQLPKVLVGKSLEEKKAFVEKKSKERLAIQKQIKDLDAKRQKFIADHRAKNGAEKADTLGTAVIKAVRQQAAKQNFKFEKP